MYSLKKVYSYYIIIIIIIIIIINIIIIVVVVVVIIIVVTISVHGIKLLYRIFFQWRTSTTRA
jgi:hypothetical protein